MNPRTICTGSRHLHLEDIPGPNDTVDRTIVTADRPCTCDQPADRTKTSRP
jgi:hypothetical protein